jgi:hypothetical protein
VAYISLQARQHSIQERHFPLIWMNTRNSFLHQQQISIEAVTMLLL